MRVLIAEDDDNIRNGLKEIAEGEGYTPLLARDGIEALAIFAREAPDFVCLDIMMPGRDGYAICRKIRESHPDLPIIFISAKSEEIDKVLGLELGADDFIVKPFGIREVVARIRAVTRRCIAKSPASMPVFRMRNLEIDRAALQARREGDVIDLSLRDLKILELLHQNRGKVLDRYAFFSHCWGADHVPNSRTLDQHISQLRKRIESDPRNPAIIRTVHGVGYRYDE